MEKRNSHDAGVALLELVIVGFLIFLIPLSTVELSRILQAQQTATVLSRDLASVVYRECIADNEAFPSPRTAPPSSRFDPRPCIPGAIEAEFRARINPLFPGCATDNRRCPKLSLSLFGANDSGTVVERDFFFTDDTADRVLAKFDPVAIRSDALSTRRSDLGSSLVEYRTLVVGQVRVPYRSTGFGAGVFVSFFVDRVYGVAII